jgi:hypothetical protein
MHEEIVNLLRKSPGVSSEELAREFFKIKKPDPQASRRMIEGVLGGDRRCFVGDDGLWHASPVKLGEAVSQAAQDLRTMPWFAVHVLLNPAHDHKKIFHVSVWSLFPTPTPQYNEWFENPETFPYEEQLSLVRSSDPPFQAQSLDDRMDALALLYKRGMPLYLLSSQSAALEQYAMARGVALSDNVSLMSQLFNLAKIPLPKPFSLAGCYRALFDRDLAPRGARGFGEALAECAAELFERCIAIGKATMEDFDAAEIENAAAFDFSSKAFSFDDLARLPQKPGVYAFQNKDGAYLYIGKAANLRRRVMGYFRESEESPEKLDRLRLEAYTLVTHLCGSDLESLIYEYRLIQKHRPLLNKQTEVSERKGAFRPIDDCIVLLPHAEEIKGMSFWFRRNQKILLKPFDNDFPSSQTMLNDLNHFFFSAKLPCAPTDFPEQEIAVRWLKSHGDACAIVPVSRMKNAEEVYAAMKAYWKEVKILPSFS